MLQGVLELSPRSLPHIQLQAVAAAAEVASSSPDLALGWLLGASPCNWLRLSLRSVLICQRDPWESLGAPVL